MIAVISRFVIENGMENEVKQAFQNRPGLVENAPGFVRLDVLSPRDNPAEIQLITYWKDDLSFDEWHRNHLKASHLGIPKGLRLVSKSWNMTRFEHISS